MDRVPQQVDPTRAAEIKLGQSGATHVPALGVDLVRRTNMSLFWRGRPVPTTIWECIMKSLVEGLETREKQLKLNIVPAVCGVALAVWGRPALM